MNLRGLVAVTGKPGLFKLIGQNKNGFVIESLDQQPVRLIVNISTTKMATLEDITIFGEDDEIRLIEVLKKMKESSDSIPEAKSDGMVLRNFFREVAPDHEESRVYTSDIKKIITWYNIIKELPLFDEPEPEPLQAEE
ncbi:MAG TPA: DUF5606 domain-containing protein [Sphingobacteriaceae bacterium]|nr:DUF5606 domain-containing protein [Sphingobacteriaceae bacterium]